MICTRPTRLHIIGLNTRNMDLSELIHATPSLRTKRLHRPTTLHRQSTHSPCLAHHWHSTVTPRCTVEFSRVQWRIQSSTPFHSSTTVSSGKIKIHAACTLKLLFGLRGRRVEFFMDSSLSKPLLDTTQVSTLNGQTVYIMPFTGSTNGLCGSPAIPSPICHFANVVNGKQMGCVLLENPRGQQVSMEGLFEQVRRMYKKDGVKLNQEDKKTQVSSASVKDVLELHSTTLYTS